MPHLANQESATLFFENSGTLYPDWRECIAQGVCAAEKAIVAIDEETDFRTLGELSALLNKLPRLDEELYAFAEDLEDISKDQPPMAMGDLWE